VTKIIHSYKTKQNSNKFNAIEDIEIINQSKKYKKIFHIGNKIRKKDELMGFNYKTIVD